MAPGRICRSQDSHPGASGTHLTGSHETGQACPPWAERGPGSADVQNGDRSGGELGPHAVQDVRPQRAARGTTDRIGDRSCQHEREYPDGRVMPDHHDGPGRRRRATDDADQLSRGCVINAVIKYHRYRCLECDRGELPCLTSPAGCRAQNLVGNAMRIPEPPPHSGSIPATSAGQRPIMIWHRGPGRLGMPDQHQPPTLPRCHDHSVPGPIRQVSALQNALTASGHENRGTRPLSCVGVHRQRPPPHRLVADRRRRWPVARVAAAARWSAPQRTGARGRSPPAVPTRAPTCRPASADHTGKRSGQRHAHRAGRPPVPPRGRRGHLPPTAGNDTPLII